MIILVLSWYIFPSLGIMHQEKSGNPGHDGKRHTTYACFCWSLDFYVVQIFDNFVREKIGIFLKNQCYDQFFE
jgi:hypothetical protein